MALFLVAGVAYGHAPSTDGGPAQKGCAPVIDDRYYVGATKMSCGQARTLARRAIKDRAHRIPAKWKCTGIDFGFGHCHHKKKRRKLVHWAVND